LTTGAGGQTANRISMLRKITFNTVALLGGRSIISKPFHECKFEAHRTNIDIHYIIEGTESIAVEDVNNFNETIPYDQEKDIAFYESIEEQQALPIYLKQGMFMVCFPHETHCTAIMYESPATIKKIVVKIRYSSECKRDTVHRIID